jgi:hypothetical protein
MRPLCLLGVLLCGALAQAQVARPLGETPLDPGPAPRTLPEAAAPVSAGSRHSAFSAGPGGPLFAFSLGLDGAVLGSLVGFSLLTRGDALAPVGALSLGGVAGAALLGGLGVLIQYVQPIGLFAAGATGLGLGVGALAGAGVGRLLDGAGLPRFVTPLLAVGGSLVGGLIPLALLWGADDLQPGALAVLGAFSLGAFAAAGFVNLAVGAAVSAPALLLAPAAGMAVGGLVAALSTPRVAPVLRFTLVPLGAALALCFGSMALGASPQVAGVVGLSAAAVGLGVTALVTVATEVPAVPAGVTLLPSVTAVRGEGGALVVGPSVTGRF